MTRTRVDCQSSSEDRCEAVRWRRAGKANVSDMAAQLDHADDDVLLRDRPCTAMGCCVPSGEQLSVNNDERRRCGDHTS